MRLLGAVLTGVLLTTAAFGADDDTYAGEVTASTLNLRAGPSESYQPVVTAKQGTKVIVLGAYANDPAWLLVEVPTGYTAWVSGEFVKRTGDKGEVQASRVLVRPTASTRYHQLSGRLEKGETVSILEEKKAEDGVWYRIKVPRRIPLYAAARYLKKIGPASLAEVKEPEAAAGGAAPLTIADTAADKQFVKVEADARKKMTAAKTTAEIELVRKSVASVDGSQLNADNRDKRVKLLSDILEKERVLAVDELKAKETEVNSALDQKLAEIDRKYKKRLAEIREEYEHEKKPRYVATGIVQWSPDVFGRYPSYRLVEGDKMRYYLIANEFDLGRFVNKRVGVVGIMDPESGTGYETVMVKRIEILGNE
jgi:hypothetical protein